MEITALVISAAIVFLKFILIGLNRGYYIYRDSEIISRRNYIINIFKLVEVGVINILYYMNYQRREYI